MRIRALWIDDDYKTDVIGDAELDGIDIVPFESHEEGIEALLKDIKGFHAVILDAKVKKAKDDTVTNLKGLRASRDKLIELNKQGEYLPYFIFTGQPDYMNNEDFRDSYGDFYIKGQDNQKLFDDIKAAVQNKEEYIVQRDHHSIFEICARTFDVETKKTLTDILKSIKFPNGLFNDELYFTQLRIILEKLFRKANKLGLLHDKCIPEGIVNLTESRLFLSGEPTKYLNVYCSVKHFPKIISDAVKNVLVVTGAASHTTDPDYKNNIDVHDYRKLIKTPYLLNSLTFQLLDILIWFEEYKKNKSDYSINRSYWKDSNLIEGIVSKISDNGYGTFTPENTTVSITIIPSMVTKYSLQEGQKLRVNTKKEGEKTFITDIILN